MTLQRISYTICLIVSFLVLKSTSAEVTKNSVDQKISNLKYTNSSALEDSIEVVVYDLYNFEFSYGLSKIKELDQLIDDKHVNAKLRIKHSLAAFDPENKYELLDSALTFANKNGVAEFKIEYYTSKGNWYYRDQVYDSALVAILEARDLSSKLGINRELQTSHLLGDLFFSLELYEQAESYYLRCDTLLVDPRFDEVWRKRVIKNNLGLIDMKKGDYASALQVFEYSKELVPEKLSNFRDSLSIAYYNRKIGECLVALNKRYDEAIKDALFTYRFAKTHNFQEHLYPAYNLLIKLYIKTNNAELLRSTFIEYKTYYQTLQPSLDYQKENALLCAQVAEYFNDEKQALKCYKEYKELNDSETLQVKSASIIKLLTNQDYLNLKNNFNEVNQQRKFLVVAIIIALFLVTLILFFAYRMMRLIRRLNESNKTKDKLFSIIAHDLRAPFNSIVGFSELSYTAILEEDYKEVKDFNLHVLQKSKELLELINNLLNWARNSAKSINHKIARH